MKNNKKNFLIIIILLIILLLTMIWFLFFNKVTYQVTIDYDNPLMQTKIEKYDKGSTIGDIAIPIRDGYTFLYWTVDGKKVESTDKIAKDIKLVAVWEINKTKIKIKLNNDGGEGETEIEVEKGSTIVELTAPTKEGYKFQYWESNGEKYDFTKPVTEEIQLKAVWKKVEEYTVTFDSNGGSIVPKKTVYCGEKIGTLSTPTKKGFTFDGWYTASSGGKKVTSSTIASKSLTVYAHWINDIPEKYRNLSFARDETIGTFIWLYSNNGYEGYISRASIVDKKVKMINALNSDVYYSNINNVKYIASFYNSQNDDISSEFVILSYDGYLYITNDYSVEKKLVYFEKINYSKKIKELFVLEECKDYVCDFLYVLNEDNELLKFNLTFSHETHEYTYSISGRYEDRN